MKQKRPSNVIDIVSYALKIDVANGVFAVYFSMVIKHISPGLYVGEELHVSTKKV